MPIMILYNISLSRDDFRRLGLATGLFLSCIVSFIPILLESGRYVSKITYLVRIANSRRSFVTLAWLFSNDIFGHSLTKISFQLR